MIIEFICNWILGSSLIQNMKPLSAPQSLITGLTSLLNYLGFVSPVLNIGFLFTVIEMVLSVFALSLLLKFILGFFHK